MTAKVAVISDVHGNLPALEAVRKALVKERPDHVVIAGDHVFQGPDPAACVDALRDMEAKGATIVTGGKARPDIGPAFFEPTILEGVTKDMLAGSCETFGPVVALHRYSTVDEAVALANDTDYGLNASVWGTDLKAAEAVARRIESGNVNVNDALAAAWVAVEELDRVACVEGLLDALRDWGCLT